MSPADKEGTSPIASIHLIHPISPRHPCTRQQCRLSCTPSSRGKKENVSQRTHDRSIHIAKARQAHNTPKSTVRSSSSLPLPARQNKKWNVSKHGDSPSASISLTPRKRPRARLYAKECAATGRRPSPAACSGRGYASPLGNPVPRQAIRPRPR